MTAAIQCEGLTKRFGKIVAVDNLSLAIEEHTVFGFLGPNGAGKTTTIKLFTGLSAPTAGRAWVAGEPVALDALSVRRKMGYLPENPAFYHWMTGRETIVYVGELFGLSPRENRARCDELLELVGLTQDARRRVGGYSRGMRQRLGIAQALANHPQALFLDEPCSALDPMGRREVLELIQRLGQDTTVFMSSHILSDVERVCSSVGIIHRGCLVAESTIEELRHRNAHSVFELRFEEDATSFTDRLRAIPWVSQVETATVDGVPVLRVHARDLDVAKRELPAVVASSGLTLLRYEMGLPRLEDIFLELVGDGAVG